VLVGAGRMGGALLKGWLANGLGPIEIVDVNPSPQLRALAKAKAVRLHKRIEDIEPRNIRVCVIALKPQVLKTEAIKLRAIAQSGALMLSIAAGTRIATFAKQWGKGVRIIRAMPNTPGSIGKGITAIYTPPKTKPADRKLAQSLLAPLGETIAVTREALIDTVTAVSGSGPAYVFLMVEALADAAQKEGIPRADAQKLARATIMGAGALLEADRRDPAELRRDVTSPHGTTEAALAVLMAKEGLPSLVLRAVSAARKRGAQLGA
jgi:pyrroline-5-carboxylate reductase